MAPTSIGANPGSVYVVVSVAAGNDFQFKSLRSPIPAPESEAQSLIDQFQSSLFPILGGGDTPVRPVFDIFENSLTVEQCCLRFSTRPPDQSFATIVTPEARNKKEAPNTQVWDILDFIAGTFRYVRGSVRLKNPVAPSLTALQELYMPGGSIGESIFPVPGGNGLVVIDPEVTPVLEMEVPYIARTNWTSTNYFQYMYTALIRPYAPAINISTTDLYVAAGRDYQLAHYLAPFVNTQYTLVDV
jgi:hypothetical protein